MKSFEEMDYHPKSEQLVQILMDETQNRDPQFFRLMVAFYWSMAASMMRTNIAGDHQKPIPVNMFAFNLAPSGAGKTKCSGIMEERVLDQFRYNFTQNTFPLLAQRNLPVIAQDRAMRWGTDIDAEEKAAQAEFKRSGSLLFSFDSATTAAIKQARHKLLMANAGSLNLMIDEVGNNLSSTREAFDTYLELYDVGRIKQKLVKNTADNERAEELHGLTPANMMAFGVPHALLNSAKTQEEYMDLLAVGYARRCFFGFAKKHRRTTGMTPETMWDQQTANTSSSFMDDLADHMGNLADMVYANKDLIIEKPVALLFNEYQLRNIDLAEGMAEHEDLRKSEVSHRHFKAMKLAGAYAFIDGSGLVTEDHAYNAIKLAEASGQAFDAMLQQDPPHARLAQYVASVDRELTQPDLMANLPFYKGTASAKSEMMQHAIAWGYQNNIIIKRNFTSNIEMFSAETLKVTDTSKLIISYSDDMAYRYMVDDAPWDDLHKLTQAEDMHWANHAFSNGHRCEDNAIPGFNLIALDIDNGLPLSTAQLLLKDYKALFYTTKRHTAEKNRYRIILPTNYVLQLDSEEYREFMANFHEWLPFEVDEAVKQRSRKWMSNPGEFHYQDGQLVNVLPFIPKTHKNEEFKQQYLDQAGMNNLERWVLNNTTDGNRNNQLLRFAMVYVDAGFGLDDIKSAVKDLNKKLSPPLAAEELERTIYRTAERKIDSRAAA